MAIKVGKHSVQFMSKVVFKMIQQVKLLNVVVYDAVFDLMVVDVVVAVLKVVGVVVVFLKVADDVVFNLMVVDDVV